MINFDTKYNIYSFSFRSSNKAPTLAKGIPSFRSSFAALAYSGSRVLQCPHQGA